MKYALCKGRHAFPKDCVGYIFPHHVDPTDLKRLTKETEKKPYFQNTTRKNCIRKTKGKSYG